MIGIDIIDINDFLLHPRNGEHMRFIKAKDDKYPKDIDPNLLYWIVWSAKEAIFKSKRQLNVFDPKLITITFSNDLNFYSKQLSGSIEITPNYVMAIAAQESIKLVNKIWINHQKVCSQKAVRERIIEYFKPINVNFTLDGNQLPLLSVNEGEKIPISLTHHGMYMGFCIEKHKILRC